MFDRNLSHMGIPPKVFTFQLAFVKWFPNNIANSPVFLIS